MKQALDALPAAVLTALIAPALTTGAAEIVAGVATFLAATRLPMIVAIGVGMACLSLLR